MNLVDWLWTLLVIFFMVMFFMIFFMVIIDLFGDASLGGGAKALLPGTRAAVPAK